MRNPKHGDVQVAHAFNGIDWIVRWYDADRWISNRWVTVGGTYFTRRAAKEAGEHARDYALFVPEWKKA